MKKEKLNHKEWLLRIDNCVNCILVFGSIIDLSICASFGFKVASLTAFAMFMIAGLGKTAISIINFFHK
jgi:predicted membrane channel-forming protein YqfA (hemolysin III family)